MTRSGESCFTLLRSVDVSVTGQPSAAVGGYQATREVMSAGFCVRWPDGTPCTLIEVYLVHRYRNGATVQAADGGSLRTIASKLSHLIRFCWDTGCDFWELDDDRYFQFIKGLSQARRRDAPALPCRDGNTVRAISGECVAFLKWLQDFLGFRDDLIGDDSNFRIRLKPERGRPGRRGHGQGGGAYRRLPPIDTREPKRPMPTAHRNRLWDAVSAMPTPRVKPAWCTTPQDGEWLSSFLKSRRELLLYLLEATGARPGELARLSVTANADCYKTKKLTLPTLKRRRVVQRVIDLQPDLAMRLELFIYGYRATLLLHAQHAGGVRSGDDRVFLGCQGRPLDERALASDFARIVRVAHLDGVQSCMSMFRHRFITKQVAIHLQTFLSNSGAVRALVTEADYRSILKKVAVVTGHGDPESLLAYIDLAWDELGAFHRVEAAQRIEAVVDATMARVISLCGEVRRRHGRVPSIVEKALEALEALRRDVHEALGSAHPNQPTML